jgi:hypothetical protein
MDAFAAERGLMAKTGKTGRNYQPRQAPGGAQHTSGIGIYSTGKAEFNLLIFRELGRDDLADDMLQRIAEHARVTPTAVQWPSVPWELLARDWDRSRVTLLEPYFDAREQLHPAG